MADNKHVVEVGVKLTAEGAAQYQETMKGVNATIGQSYEEFKKSMAMMDKNATATEKLTVKQKYLAEQYDSYQKKVAILSGELEQLTNAEEKDEAAIAKKQKELTRAETSLIKYGKSLNDITDELKKHSQWTDKVSDGLDKASEKLESAGKKTAVASAAAAGGLIAVGKAAIDAESAFTGVVKTVDATDDKLAEIKEGLIGLSEETTTTAVDIMGVAEAAGQLGIKADDIVSFTKTMVMLGDTTNLTAEDAATSIAKIANITNMSMKDVDRFGSTIVALGNNFATTEADILAMTTRLASSGNLAGLTEPQMLALATALQSVGVEAQAGGSAASKLMKSIQVAVETGNEQLTDFAKVAGISVGEFKKLFAKDAVMALDAFITGLNDTERNGKSAIVFLDEMGIKEVNLSNAILSLSSSQGLLTKTVELGNKAWESNTALSDEAALRYGTTESKIAMLKNQVINFAASLGELLLPTIENIINGLSNMVAWLNSLDQGTKQTILTILAIVAAISPLLISLGKIAGGLSALIDLLPILKTGIAAVIKALKGFATAHPVIAAIAAIAAVVAVAYGAFQFLTRDVRAAREEIKRFGTDVPGLTEALQGIQPTLLDINGLLSSSGKSLHDLSTAMGAAEQAITDVLSAALSEQRALRQEDLDSIRNYMDDLLALQAEKMQIYQDQQISVLRMVQAEGNQITQETALQMISNANAAYEQANQAAYDNYNAQVTILENKYKAMGAIDSAAHQAEIAEAKNHYHQATSENQTYNTNTIAQVTNASATWIEADRNKWEKLNSGQKISSKEYTETMSQINDGNTKMFLQMVATTKEKGGELDQTSKNNAKMILDAYSNLPRDLKAAGKESLLGMIGGIESMIPGLENISEMTADEIIGAIKTKLEIQSPSKVMYRIGQQTVEGAEDGLKSKKASLKRESESIGDNLVTGMMDGIEGKQSWFQKHLGGFVDSVVGGIKSLFGIRSPSSVTRDEVGAPIVDGIAVGMVKNKGKILDAMASIIPSITAFGNIPMMAAGGNLLRGMAVVAEAGPELIQQQGGRTAVTPLGGGGSHTSKIALDDETLDRLATKIADAIDRTGLGKSIFVFEKREVARMVKSVL